MFFGKKLIRAYVVLFYYVPNQNKVFLFLSYEEGIDVTQFQSIITEYICNLGRKTNIIVLVDGENYSLLRIL